MTQNFREILRNDSELMHLLNVTDKNAIDENGEITIGDFHGTW